MDHYSAGEFRRVFVLAKLNLRMVRVDLWSDIAITDLEVAISS